ncbi:histone-lysine N-methyltransferase SETMAR [Trichonephila clavipes]|nr:histone-lysine N-methyltransferase SETMAR [Trichonephila clavipes]
MQRAGMLNEGVIFLHDNARPHIAQVKQELLYWFKLKKHFSGKRFSSDSAVKKSAETWLNGQGLDFYQDGLSKLVLRSDKCLNSLGDYVKNDRHMRQNLGGWSFGYPHNQKLQWFRTKDPTSKDV